MNIELRFFASVREALGISSERLMVPDTVATVGAVRDYLAARGGVWAKTLDAQRAIRIAYDHQMVEADVPISEGGEVAFFPPVTGG